MHIYHPSNEHSSKVVRGTRWPPSHQSTNRSFSSDPASCADLSCLEIADYRSETSLLFILKATPISQLLSRKTTTCSRLERLFSFWTRCGWYELDGELRTTALLTRRDVHNCSVLLLPYCQLITAPPRESSTRCCDRTQARSHNRQRQHGSRREAEVAARNLGFQRQVHYVLALLVRKGTRYELLLVSIPLAHVSTTWRYFQANTKPLLDTFLDRANRIGCGVSS